MFFLNPLPEPIFRGPECRSSLKSAVLERFTIFQGSQNQPLERQIRDESQKTSNHNSITPQTISLKPWPGGMRVSD